jgi:L-ascorbate metabolism protein UlaG (beta-lactamase superfamily)
MVRFLAAMVLGLAIGAVALAADKPGPVKIRWHGQSFFEIISSKGTRIVTDPHNLDAFPVPPNIKADVITMSHIHNDHSFVSSVQNYQKAHVLAGWVRRGQKLDWNTIDEQFRDVHIKTVGTYHDDSNGGERGKNTVFIFDLDGMRIVHLGDLGHQLNDAQLKAIGKVDVLMIPVGGVFTINGEEAQKVVEQIKPRKYILPMHYGTKNLENLQTPEEFLEDQKPENIKRLKTNELVVRPDFHPKEPVIVFLDWRDSRAPAKTEQ